MPPKKATRRPLRKATIHLKTDKKTGDKYLFIGKKKYWIKNNTPKTKIVSFVKDRFKKLGYAPKKYVVSRSTMTRIKQGKTPRPPRPPRASLESKMEQIQQMRASPAEYELYRLSKDALLNIAQQAGIIGYKGMRKDQLIASIASIPPKQDITKVIEDEIEKKEQKEQEKEIRKPVKATKPEVTENKEPIDDLTNLSKWDLNKIGRSLNMSKSDIRLDAIKLRKLIRELRAKPQERESESKTRTKPSPDENKDDSDFLSPILSPPNSDEYNRSVARQARINRERNFVDMAPITQPETKPPEDEKTIPVLPRLLKPPNREYTSEEIKELDREKALLEARRQIRERGQQNPSDSEFNWEGEGKKMTGKGISNFDIDNMLKPFPEYLGCISSDELISKILPQIQPQSRAFWVNNLSPSTSGGSHWVSFFVDARPEGSNSIEYSDSFGDPIPDEMRQDIQQIADKLNAEKYLKLKENTLVQRQGDKTSNCGFFAVKFVLDRMRDKSFAESTGFDSSIRDESADGEKDISKFKTQMGWGFIPSFMRRPNSFADQIKNFVFFPAKELSNPFKKFMSQYGHYKIIKATIRRQPIGWAIDKLLNVISLGTWSAGKKELNYPDLFHLGIVLDLSNNQTGKKVILEKLERPHFTESWKDDANVEYYPVQLKYSTGTNAYPTLNEFVQKTIDKIGIHAFTQYAGFRGDKNCQNFIMDLLNANSSLTPGAKTFIYQPIEELVKKMPSWVDKISQGVTDFSARARQFFGVGKKLIFKPNPRLDALLKNFQK